MMPSKNVPPAHVTLDRQKILETNSPRCTWCGFEHEAAELGMEDRRGLAFSVLKLAKAAKSLQKSVLLCFSTNQVGHTSTLFEELRITCESLENVGLPQRKLHFLLLVVKAHHKVLDLAQVSTMSDFQISFNLSIPRHPRAAHCAPFPLCCAR